MTSRIISLAVLVLAVLSVDSLWAQSKPIGGVPAAEISGLPIDQLPPGARALGLGGAFTAVADDATAALANPAGLANLSAPEASIFIRNTDADVPFLDPDAFSSGLNAIAGDRDKLYTDSSTDLSFASFVFPMDRVVLSAFYSNQLNFSSAQVAEDQYLDDIQFPGPSGTEAFFDQYTNFNSIDGKLENYGASVAFRFTQRLHDETTAYETGIFRYTLTPAGSNPRIATIHFEGMLVRKDGTWLLVMEYQKRPATDEEWETASR